MTKTTKVYLLNLPIERDYKHTIYFNNDDGNGRTRQFEEFTKHKIKSYENFSYQRKDGIIRVPAKFDEVITCNYVLYQNPDFNNKWFYAFITDIKYVQPDRTDIYIETDCIQTWMFDIKIQPSFVEREHVKDDTPGKHTFPEQLETGDYIANKKIKYQKLVYRAFVVGSTIDLAAPLSEKFPNVDGTLYNGIYSGIRYYYFKDSATLSDILLSVAEAGKSDGIVSIFMVPSEFLQSYDTEDFEPRPLRNGEEVPFSVGPVTERWYSSGYLENEFIQEKITKLTTINGYEPKNNKLFTYPYSYILMSNNSGGAAVYKYELFSIDGVYDFYINFALTPGGSIRIIPKDYNGVEANNEEGLNAGKLPICAWTTDVYTNWLTQNSVNISVQLARSAYQMTAGAISSAAQGASSGNIVGAVGSAADSVANGIFDIASTMGEIYAHSLQPPQAEGNINSGDVTMSNGDLTFTAYQMTIKAEYAEMIDNFFTMFGYKVNLVKIPNTNHRRDYWYTKTIDVNIDGNIPQQDLQIIKNAYDKGITFWRDTDLIGTYTKNPTI